MSSGDVSHGGVDSSNHAGEEVTVNIRLKDGSKFPVQVYLDSTVEFLKSILAQKCDIPIHQQNLIYRGIILKDDETLQSYETSVFAELHVSTFLDYMLAKRFLHAQLSQLREMGFTDTRENIRALIAAAGNVNAAVDRLTANPAQ